MKRLYVTAAACAIMAALIPFAPDMAVVLDGSLESIAPHFLFPFGHANLLHWLINSWSLLVLHNVLRWYRFLLAYVLAVVLSFVVPYIISDSQPVIGLSVITTFFFGYITPYYWAHNKSVPLMMMALLVIGCFLPGITAVFHIVPYVVGVVYCHIERTIRSVYAFITN